jgi:pimeloyl-ACP methyl ester carboxylesterase
VLTPARGLIVAAILAAAAVLRLMRPVPTGSLTAHPRPARTYGEAVARLAELVARDGPEVDSGSRSRALLHEGRTERVVLLIHGLSSSPQMWHELGRRFFDLGYNVLIGRLPRHGITDRMTTQLAQLRAEDLVRFADDMVDIAAGLGDEVTVLGISLGGVITAWIAEQRPEVHTAFLVNPNFSAPHLRGRAAMALTNALLVIPNRFIWWDMKAKDKALGPAYAYPRFSTRAVGQAFRLGQAVERLSHAKPVASRAIVMTAAADPAVSNVFTDRVVSNWRKAGLTRLVTYRWPKDLIASHDILSPEQPYQQIDVVYPKILQMIEDA